MPNYTLIDPATQAKVRITANRPPTQEEAAELLAQALQKVEVQPEVEYSGIAEGARQVGQGLTFGFGDEIESGATALYKAATEGAPFDENYRKRYKELEQQRSAFEEDYPYLSPALEIVGALPTGIAGAARTGALRGLNQASKIGQAGRLAGVGAAEGAIYGAGKAKPDEIFEDAAEGAAMGAVLTPVGSGAVNLIGDLISGAGNFASRKLADTPRQQADRVLRQAMIDEDLTPETAVTRLQELNEATPGFTQATLADLGDSFRTQGRATMDVGDSAKGKARDFYNERQAGQRARVKTLIKNNFGADAENFFDDFNSALTARSKAANPIYNDAFDQGVMMTQSLQDFVEDKTMAPIYKEAQARFASLSKPEGYGYAPGNEPEVTLRSLDFLKKRLDGRIGAAKTKGDRDTVRFLQIKKKELLDLINEQNKTYGQALRSFTDDSAVINAMEDGLKFLKKDPDLLNISLQDLTEAEIDAFRMGAVKSMQNLIESQGDNTDVVKRLIGSEAMRKRLQAIMPAENVNAFLRGLDAESEFFRTRSAITAGPNTAERLQAAKRLEDEVSPDLLVSLSMGDPTFLVPQVAKVLAKGKATPEVVEALSDSLFDAGLTTEQIIDILSKPTIRKQFADRYDETVGRIINKQNVRAGITPATMAATSEE